MIINKVKGEVYARYDNIASLSKVLGWSRQKLSLIVNGKAEPTLSDIQAMASAMCMSAEELASFFLDLASQKVDE